MDGVVEFLDLDGEVMFDYELNYELVRPLPLGVKISGAEGLLPWRQYARPAVLGQNEFFSGSQWVFIHVIIFINILLFLLIGNRTGDYKWEQQRGPSGIWKGTIRGEVICFSACDRDQLAFEDFVSWITYLIFFLI